MLRLLKRFTSLDIKSMLLIDFFKLFISDDIINTLVQNTNTKAIAELVWWGEVGHSRNHLIYHVHAAPCSRARAWTIVIPVPKISCILVGLCATAPVGSVGSSNLNQPRNLNQNKQLPLFPLS
jgi:hypothetical protein